MGIELIGAITYFAALITVGSLYMGLCLYIHAMVMDMKAKMTQSVLMPSRTFNGMRSVDVKEIDFHNDIVG